MTTNGSITDKIQELAATDEQFRAALMKDPRAAIASLVGRPLPDHINVKVIEETADSLVIVLPPATAGTELSDAQLEAVSGGAGCPWCWSTSGTYCFFTS